MIAAGVLLTGLTLTAGRADAATTGVCTIGALTYRIESADISADATGRCQQGGALVSTAGSGLTAVPTNDPAPTIAPVPAVSPAPALPAPVVSPSPSQSPTTAPAAGGGATTGPAAGSRPAAAPAAVVPAAPLPAAVVPAAAPAAVVPAAPLPAATLPSVVRPALGVPAAGVSAPFNLAAPLPSGLASGLFSAGTINPALLSGASTTLPAATLGLYPPGVGSAVDTVSSARALLSDTPRSVGTPTAVAAIMLACVAAVVIRHRILTRLRRDFAPDPHDPGDEPVEDLDKLSDQVNEQDAQPSPLAQYA